MPKKDTEQGHEHSECTGTILRENEVQERVKSDTDLEDAQKPTLDWFLIPASHPGGDSVIPSYGSTGECEARTLNSTP